MKKALQLLLALIILLPPSLHAASRRDPLTAKESDELREAASDPEPRLRLFISFATARLTAIEDLRADPRLAVDRGRHIHDLLEDFTAILDELGVNEDEYIDQKYDVRKALKAVLEAESSFQLKLRKLKESTASGPAAEEAREYQFMLDSALDAVNSSLDDTRSALSEQEQNQKELKHKPQA